MGSFTAISAGSNIQDKTWLREIEQGIYERFLCSGASGCPAWATSTGSTAAGDNIQQASFWAARQNAIGTLITNATHKFMQVGSYASVPTTFPDVNNTAAISTHTAASTLWALASGNSSGPRRCPTTPGSYSYGACQAGDIIGTWLITDLQRALCYLRYVEIAAGSISAGTTYASGASSAWNEGVYLGNSTWNQSNFAYAQNDHDANVAAWSSKSDESILARWRQEMSAAYILVGEPMEYRYYYNADSYSACRSQTVTLPTASFNHKLHIGGVWAAYGAAADGYYGIHSATHGAYVTSGNVGIVGLDSSWQSGTSRSLDLRNMVSRIYDRTQQRPVTVADVRDYDCKVTDTFVLAEWQWTKDTMP